MEENKFEKQVRQRMDEFTVQPSEKIWDKIEARIEKKKRTRLALILLSLFFCIVLSGGYWLWNCSQHNVAENKNFDKEYSNTERNIDNKLHEKENYTTQPKTDSSIASTNQNKNSILNIGVKKSINKKSATRYKLMVKSTGNTNINSPQSTINSPEKEPDISEKNNVTIDNLDKLKSKIDASRPEEIQKNESEFAKTNDSSNEKIGQDTLSKFLLVDAVAKSKDTSTQKKSISKTVHKPSKNKWKTGISFSGGLSNIGNSVLDIQTSSYYSYDPTLNNSSSGSSGQGSVYYPSNSRCSFGFIIGISEEKNITPQIKIALGLNFTSLKIRNKVGSIINNSTGSYNSQNAINNYNNYFNFIDLPVTFKVQIGKAKGMPLSWQAGISLSELVSTNALQFNSAGYYYKDNSLFNKTQLGFNTGFYATLFSKQKVQLLIGPYLYYDASKMAAHGIYNKKHFVFTGLQTQILFGK